MTTSAPELPDFAPKLRLTQSHADVTRDVVAGRAQLNFSEWNRPQKEAKEAAEGAAEGEGASGDGGSICPAKDGAASATGRRT